MTQARDTGELVNDVGTAGYADVQTSPTDTTVDALMAVGAFGLGSPLILTGSDDLNDYDDSTFLVTSSSTINNPTSNGSYIITNGTGTSTATQIAIDIVEDSMYMRTRLSGVWSSWKQIDPQGFGLGDDGVAVDWDAPTASVLAESSLNSPIGGTSVLGVNVKSGTTQSAFVGRNNRFFGRTIEAGSVQAWRELWHDNNYQPETSNGIGVVKRMANNSGGSISNQATVAGSSLLFFQSDSNGITVSAGAASGTWMNVTGLSVAASNRGDFVRIA